MDYPDIIQSLSKHYPTVWIPYQASWLRLSKHYPIIIQTLSNHYPNTIQTRSESWAASVELDFFWIFFGLFLDYPKKNPKKVQKKSNGQFPSPRSHVSKSPKKIQPLLILEPSDLRFLVRIILGNQVLKLEDPIAQILNSLASIF